MPLAWLAGLHCHTLAGWLAGWLAGRLTRQDPHEDDDEDGEEAGGLGAGELYDEGAVGVGAHPADVRGAQHGAKRLGHAGVKGGQLVGELDADGDVRAPSWGATRRVLHVRAEVVHDRVAARRQVVVSEAGVPECRRAQALPQ